MKLSSLMPGGLVPLRSVGPSGPWAPTNESYSGSSQVPANVNWKLSVGYHIRSSSRPSVDCLPALARSKPVPVKMLDWKPSISCEKMATLSRPVSQPVFNPISYTVDSSGLAKRVPGTRLLTVRPAVCSAGMSAANGRESRDRFQDEALKPVAYDPYTFTLSIRS